MGRHQQPRPVRRNGAYHARYYITENGSRVQKSHRLCAISDGANKAKQLLADFLADHVNVGKENYGPIGVVAFWDDVYLPFIEHQADLKPATVHGYKQVWRQHLKAHFGTICLHEYTTGKLSQLLTSLAKTKRPGTLASIKWLASAIFAHAVATDHCETNPCRDAKVLGKSLAKQQTGSYTLEEAENAITALVDHLQAQVVMALCFFLGLRKGEIAALKWEDFDGGFECVHIRRAVSRGEVGLPKSNKSLRSIPIIKQVRTLLMLWRSKNSGDGWVFKSERNTPLSLDLLAVSVIRPALMKAGVPWRGYHAGRRGLGAKLKALTGNSAAGRDMLGHFDERVTQEHYERPLPETAAHGARLLEAQVKDFPHSK
jgi:integrase